MMIYNAVQFAGLEVQVWNEVQCPLRMEAIWEMQFETFKGA